MKKRSRKPTQVCRKGIFLSAYPLSLIRTLLCVCCALLFATSCEHASKDNKINYAVAQEDVFPDKATIRYAKGFTLSYHGTYKMVNILNHFEDRVDTLQYLLVQRGTAVPSHSPDVQVIEIPVQQLVGMSSMHVGLVDFAEAADVLVGLGNLKYVSSAHVRENIKAGKVKEVGNGGALNNELLISMQPDLVMVTGSPDAKLSLYQTLQAAGIPVMINSEWLETTPLGRAEWVKLLAALLNKEALVNEKFANVEQEYHKLMDLTSQAKTKPSVITSMPFKGTWAVPDGDSYMARFLKDAATTYEWSDVQGKGSLQLDFERVAPVALQADFWLNVGYVDTKEDIAGRDVRYKDFKPFRQGTIFNNNKRVNDIGANDYWESGAVNPHLILADLIRILHPELLPGHELVYYKPIR
ncbi:ABC transporter substrate-binding protein [Pontibacter silvestris]|uniref:ABC transporter substrate-binding protein n=1 Tax=Pontibacter silvestris TaxID=2305183 RepID=A0ABW4WZP9_9BACT|nr:ABC transporter substrate-binding protein [Pontibacter silvestris]MCC9138213.1 ABC transporter substrate-binding protein [Pontibacter silvestris]